MPSKTKKGSEDTITSKIIEKSKTIKKIDDSAKKITAKDSSVISKTANLSKTKIIDEQINKKISKQEATIAPDAKTKLPKTTSTKINKVEVIDDIITKVTKDMKTKDKNTEATVIDKSPEKKTAKTKEKHSDNIVIDKSPEKKTAKTKEKINDATVTEKLPVEKSITKEKIDKKAESETKPKKSTKISNLDTKPAIPTIIEEQKPIPQKEEDFDDLDDDSSDSKPRRGRPKKDIKPVSEEQAPVVAPKMTITVPSKPHAEYAKKHSEQNEPSESKPNKPNPNVRFSDEDLAEFRTKIMDYRHEAVDELRMLRERLDDLTNYDFAEESMIYSMHMAEQGSEALEKEKTYAQIQRINEYLKKLDEALQRIAEKTYGICRVCGCLIAKERLLAVPVTTLSASYKIHKRCPDDGIDRIEPLKN